MNPDTTTETTDTTSEQLTGTDMLSVETRTAQADPGPAEAEAVKSETDSVMALLMFGVGVYLLKLWLEDLFNAKKGNPHPKAFPGAFGCPMSLIWLGIGVSLIIVVIETIGEAALGVSATQSNVAFTALFAWIAAGFYEELIFRGLGGNTIDPAARQDYILASHGMALPKHSGEATIELEQTDDDLESKGTPEDPVATEPPDDDGSFEVEEVKPASRTRLWVGFFLFSVFFMMLHPHLITYELATVETLEPEIREQLGLDEATLIAQGKDPEEDATLSWTNRIRYSKLEAHFSKADAWWSSIILLTNSIFWFWLRFHPANTKRSILPCIAGHVASNAAVFLVKLLQGHVVAWW